MIKGALEADGRLAAKNAVKIRAALRQVADFKRVFDKYQETQPQPTDNPAQDRARARSWIMLNVYINDEPLRLAVTRAWKDAFILGDVAAQEWIRKTRLAQKADDIEVNWDNWKPGDLATALRISGFEDYLIRVNADSYFKTFNKETIVNLGTALSDSIAAGLDAESAAVMISKHVASPSRALTIAITEQNRAMSFSSTLTYKNAGLQKMEWAVSDPCDICAKNDGQVILIGQTFASGDTQPPAHPHCRCVLLPVIPGMEDDDPMGIDGGLAPMPDGAAVIGTSEIAPTPINTVDQVIAEAKTRASRKTKVDVKAYLDNPTARTYESDRAKMAEIMTQQGSDKPSLSLPAEEFDALRDEFGTEFVAVYRGGPQGLSEGFLTGNHWVGDGNAGPGIYVTTNIDRAQSYAMLAEKSGGNSEVVRMLVPREMIYGAPDRVTWRDAGGSINPLPAPINGMSRADTIQLAADGGKAYSSVLESTSGDFVIYDPSVVIVRTP
jgi:hypothetical protein